MTLAPHIHLLEGARLALLAVFECSWPHNRNPRCAEPIVYEAFNPQGHQMLYCATHGKRFAEKYGLALPRVRSVA